LPNHHDSSPVRSEPLPLLTEAQRAQQEAVNTLLQYDRMIELINSSFTSGKPFRLRPHVIQNLNRISINRIEDEAGRWRDVEMSIDNSKHRPPTATEVPERVDELCDYVNDNWNTHSALHLAGYVMWRLNWIHPFIDGNGRTTRAVSYYVLCSKLGFYIPGVTTIPELISENKAPYYEALEAADDAHQEGGIDVSRMEKLLGDLLASQMVRALEHAESVRPSPSSHRVDTASRPTLEERAIKQANIANVPNKQYTPSNWEKIVSVLMAVVIFALVIWLAIRNQPFADPNIVVLVRIVLSVAAGVVGATIPGFLNVDWTLKQTLLVRSGGALALTVLSFIYTPKILPVIPEPKPAAPAQPSVLPQKTSVPFSENVTLKENDLTVVRGVTIKSGSIGSDGNYFADVGAEGGSSIRGRKGSTINVYRSDCKEFRIHIKNIEMIIAPGFTLEQLRKMGPAAEAYMDRSISLIVEGQCEQ